jgi:hypothetical protein
VAGLVANVPLDEQIARLQAKDLVGLQACVLQICISDVVMRRGASSSRWIGLHRAPCVQGLAEGPVMLLRELLTVTRESAHPIQRYSGC